MRKHEVSTYGSWWACLGLGRDIQQSNPRAGIVVDSMIAMLV
jgi:hypothetical protein